MNVATTAMLLCGYERMVLWLKMNYVADQRLFRNLEGGDARLPNRRRSVSEWASMY